MTVEHARRQPTFLDGLHVSTVITRRVNPPVCIT